MPAAARKKCPERKAFAARSRRRRRVRRMAQQSELLDSLVGEGDSRSGSMVGMPVCNRGTDKVENRVEEVDLITLSSCSCLYDSSAKILRKLLKHEQRETPPRLSPAIDGLSNDPTASTDNSDNSNLDTRKPSLLLPKNSDDSQGSLLDRKDEVQRLLSKTAEQEMPHLDNQCQNAACGKVPVFKLMALYSPDKAYLQNYYPAFVLQRCSTAVMIKYESATVTRQDNGTDPESAATSSVHSDDTPPRLTAAQVSSSFSSSLMDGEESRGEYCDDNASPPPLDKYASSASSPVVPGSRPRDPTVWTLRLRRRPLHGSLLSTASEAGPSVNKKNCSEADWANRLAEVLGDLHPSQLVLAKETIHSTVVKILAQEITSDISCLMNLIENQDRRAAAFERVLKDLKKFKADCTYDSAL
uniref:PABC domain-containing protein n=1 Tax=Setaria digitata TaxID=48799 RepID=A0A915PNF3_9BILA